MRARDEPVLELPELLETILRSACELLDATGGSVMLVEGDELVTLCVRPCGSRRALGCVSETVSPVTSRCVASRC